MKKILLFLIACLLFTYSIADAQDFGKFKPTLSKRMELAWDKIVAFLVNKELLIIETGQKNFCVVYSNEECIKYKPIPSAEITVKSVMCSGQEDCGKVYASKKTDGYGKMGVFVPSNGNYMIEAEKEGFKDTSVIKYVKEGPHPLDPFYGNVPKVILQMDPKKKEWTIVDIPGVGQKMYIDGSFEPSVTAAHGALYLSYSTDFFVYKNGGVSKYEVPQDYQCELADTNGQLEKNAFNLITAVEVDRVFGFTKSCSSGHYGILEWNFGQWSFHQLDSGYGRIFALVANNPNDIFLFSSFCKSGAYDSCQSSDEKTAHIVYFNGVEFYKTEDVYSEEYFEKWVGPLGLIKTMMAFPDGEKLIFKIYSVGAFGWLPTVGLDLWGTLLEFDQNDIFILQGDIDVHVMKAKEQGKPCSPEEFENCGYTSVDDFTLTRVYHVDGDASVVIFESSSVEDKDYYPIRQLGGVSQDSILAIGGKNNNIWKLVDGEFLVVKSCNAASATNTIFYKFLQSAPDEFFLFGGTSGSNKIYRLNWASCSEEDLPGDNYSLIKFLKTGTDDIWALSRTTGSYQGEVVLLHRAYQDN